MGAVPANPLGNWGRRPRSVASHTIHCPDPNLPFLRRRVGEQDLRGKAFPPTSLQRTT